MRHPVARTVSERPVRIPLDGVTLEGELAIPEQARGLVVFAHGSGSSRLSPRNRAVAAELQDGGFATLLFDLLTPDEERVDSATRELRFNIELLATRLVAATDWATQRSPARQLAIGYFGASTGAAAALVAAARRPHAVRAVVSRGGRPDLAGAALASVHAPTLLVVGGHDTVVIDLNESALREMRCPKRLEIVPRATHLFEEAGALERVSQLAREWFERYLTPAASDPTRLSAAW